MAGSGVRRRGSGWIESLTTSQRSFTRWAGNESRMLNCSFICHCVQFANIDKTDEPIRSSYLCGMLLPV